MRIHRRSLIAIASSALVSCVLALSITFVWAVPSARAAADPADAVSSEMVRLINGVRAAEGKPAVRVDPFLASKASDGTIPCPDDPSQSIEGRAKDFATYDYLSHDLRLCDGTGVQLSNVLFVSETGSLYGYWNVGEIDLSNGGYGTGKYLLSYSGTAGEWDTWTYSTTGHGIIGWLNSPSHRAIVLGAYDRVGCGAWHGSTGQYYYDCVFSVGCSSPNGTVAAPTGSPFSDPVPVSNATPVPTPVKTARPVAKATARPKAPVVPAVATVPPTAVPSVPQVPTPQPTLTPEPAPSATPVLGAQVVGGDTSGPWGPPAAAANAVTEGKGRSSAISPFVQQLVGVASGALAAILALSYLTLLVYRRRRQRSLDLS